MKSERFMSLVVVLAGFVAILFAAAAPLQAAEPDAAAVKTTSGNLRNLAIAMHKHHLDWKAFPAAAICKNGKPLLSWRVALLPALGEDKLHEQFKLDEPWDSEHNKKLLDKMPAIYAPSGLNLKEKHLTCHKVFTGPGTPIGVDKGSSLDKISNNDGSSNTFLIVEAGEPVPWTKPEDLPYDPKKELPKWEGPYDDSFFAVMCDGSVHRFSRKTDNKALRAAITYDDAATINWGKDGVIKITLK